jgi:hypothetical protein
VLKVRVLLKPFLVFFSFLRELPAEARLFNWF